MRRIRALTVTAFMVLLAIVSGCQRKDENAYNNGGETALQESRGAMLDAQATVQPNSELTQQPMPQPTLDSGTAAHANTHAAADPRAYSHAHSF